MGAHLLLFCSSALQDEDPRAESALTYVAQTSALTYAPASRARYLASGPLRTLSRLQPDELSPKVDGGVEKRNLVAALGAYLAMKPPETPKKGDPRPNKLQFPWRVPRVPSAAVAPQKWSAPPEDLKDTPGAGDGKSDSAPRSGVLLSAHSSLAPARAGPPSRSWPVRYLFTRQHFPLGWQKLGAVRERVRAPVLLAGEKAVIPTP